MVKQYQGFVLGNPDRHHEDSLTSGFLRTVYTGKGPLKQEMNENAAANSLHFDAHAFKKAQNEAAMGFVCQME